MTERITALQNKEAIRLRNELKKEIIQWPRPDPDAWKLPVGDYAVVPRDWYCNVQNILMVPQRNHLIQSTLHSGIANTKAHCCH